MNDSHTAHALGTPTIAQLAARIDQLEARVVSLEGAAAAASGPGRTRGASSAASGSSSRSSAGGSSSHAALAPPGWTVPYEVASPEPAESWIEIHEHSARPHLHRIIREVVAVEGPITEALVLRRLREIWGLRRAGARVRETFDQALRQLSYGGKLDRSADDVITLDGADVAAVRVPTDDDATRRAVDEIPSGELELALLLTARDAGRIEADDLTVYVAKTFGWTRRGAEIAATLDARLDALIGRGALLRSGSTVSPAADAD